MISAKVYPVGVEPMLNPNARRVFKKKDGTEAVILPFYNVEGEASMRIMEPVDFEDVVRAAALSSHMGRIKLETSSYQSWLYSYTSLADDYGQTRRVKSSYQDEQGKWHVKRKTVLPHLVCDLLPARYEDGAWVEQDEWGSHLGTAKEYRARMQRSNMERKGNTREDDKELQLKLVPPLDWDSTMSTQVAAEGLEEYSRPPTVVGLELKYFLKHCDTSQKRKVRKVKVRKQPAVILPWDTKTSDPSNLLKYGTPVVVGATAQYRAYVAKRDLLANVEPIRRTKEERQNRKAELTRQLLAYERQERFEQRKSAKKLQGVEAVNREIMTESQLGEFSENEFFDSDQELARYLSWMKAPEVMRVALYTDSTNRCRSTGDELRAFINKHPPSYSMLIGMALSTEEDRYVHWLATMDVHNNRLRKLKRLHLSQHLSVGERRMQITAYRIRAGRIPEDKIGEAVKILRMHAYLIKASKWRRQYPILYVEPHAWWQQNIAPPQRVGLDVQLPYSSQYMSDMEYENLTRTKRTSVDDYVEEIIQMDSFGCFGPIASSLAENSYKRVMIQLQKPIIGYLELGDSYNLHEEIGFFLPNYGSSDLERVLDQVSK